MFKAVTTDTALLHGEVLWHSAVAWPNALYGQPFSRRTNRDGTIDSICKRCFRTVGTAQEQEALKALEESHVCDPWTLEVVNIIAPH